MALPPYILIRDDLRWSRRSYEQTDKRREQADNSFRHWETGSIIGILGEKINKSYVLMQLTEIQTRRCSRSAIVSLDLLTMLIASNQCKRCRDRKAYKCFTSNGLLLSMLHVCTIQYTQAYDTSSGRLSSARSIESDILHIFRFSTTSILLRHWIARCW
jgi:hypothetical protein